MTLAADEYAHIAKRMSEIRAERERHSGVLASPLPNIAAAEPAEHEPIEPMADDYGYGCF